MADLLECLLQIKGLRETANRVAALAPGVGEDSEQGSARATALDLLSRLAATERVHAAWLRLMLLNRDRVSIPDLPPEGTQETKRDQVSSDSRGPASGDAVIEARDTFLRQRAANLELLDRCSAEDLSRTGTTVDGHTITVADLVARMLANDVHSLGLIRRALGA